MPETVASAQLEYSDRGQEQVLRRLRDLRSEALGAAKEVNQLAVSGGVGAQGMSALSGSLGAVTGLLSVFGVAVSARAALKFSMDAMEMAHASEQARVTLDALTGSAGRSAEMIEAVQRALRGAISEADAARVAGKLLSLGLAENAQEAEKFAYAAATLGKAFRNLDPGESVELFNRMLSNRSVRLLDDFGIGIAEVNKRLRELGDTSTEAFQTVVMEIAAERAEALGDVWDTSATTMDRLTAKTADYKAALGELVSAALVPAAEGFLALVDGMEAVVDATLEAQKAIGETASSVDEYRAALNAAHPAVKLLTGAQRIFANATDDSLTGLEKFLLLTVPAIPIFHRMATATLQTATGLDAQTEAEFRAIRARDVHIAETGRAENMMRQYEDAIRAATEAAEDELTAAEQLAQAYVDGLISTEEYQAGKLALMDITQQAAQKEREEAEAVREAERAMREAAQAAREMAQEQEAFTRNTLGLTDELDALRAQGLEPTAAIGQGFLDFLKASGNETMLAGKALLDYRVAVGLMSEAQANAVRAQQALDTALSDGSITVEAAEQIFRDYYTGVISNIDEAIGSAQREEQARQTLVAQTETLSEKYDHMAGRATAGAETSEDAATRQQAALTTVETRAGEVAESVEEAFGRISESADNTIPAIGRVNLALERILNRLLAIKENSNIRVNIHTTEHTVRTSDGGDGGAPVFGGNQQHGGPVRAGHQYIVGEVGPELFVPSQNGYIVPNHELGIGSASITVNVTGVLDLSDPMSADRFATRAAPAIMRELQARAA